MRIAPVLVSVSALGAFSSVFASCVPQKATTSSPAFCAKCDLSNPINKSLLPSFQEAKHEPQIADATEICARLSVDLLGKPATADDVAACASKSIDDAITDMQASDDYVIASERHWGDRFLVNDIAGDWRSIKSLYGLVDDLHHGKLAYKEFAIQAIAHPGFMTDVTDLDARGRVRRVFRAFMGRASTDAEQAELSGLFRPWLVRYDTDPDIPILYRYTPIVMSGLCDPLAACSTTMWGGASLDFPNKNDFSGLDFDTIDDATKNVLRVPGELFTAQPTFFEAGADDLLNRFLDWDEGDRNIRTPGFLFPEVREIVAQSLEKDGDYRKAERLVLESWLYTQKASVEKDGVSVDDKDDTEPSPLFTGPVKAMSAEAWLAGLQRVTSYDIGACDSRYSDGFPYFMINQAVQDGTITIDQNNQLIEQLFALRDDRGKLSSYNGELYYDYVFNTYARMLGGCPGFQNTRQKPAGVSYAILQEGIAQAFCAAGVADLAAPADGAATPESVAHTLVPLLLSRDATDDDVAAISAHASSDADLVSETCTAIVGGAEFLFR